MESDNPALSLFNVVDQNSLQNQEEEENIEDIRQRQQEVTKHSVHNTLFNSTNTKLDTKFFNGRFGRIQLRRELLR